MRNKKRRDDGLGKLKRRKLRNEWECLAQPRPYSSLLPSDLSVGKDKGRALDRLAQLEKGKELLGQLRDAKSV